MWHDIHTEKQRTLFVQAIWLIERKKIRKCMNFSVFKKGRASIMDANLYVHITNGTANITIILYIIYCALTQCIQFSSYSLQWRHNRYDGVSNHQPNHCLLNRLFLFTPRQLNCRDVRKMSLRSVEDILNYGPPNFDRISSSIEMPLVGWAPGEVGVTQLQLGHAWVIT